MKQIAVYPGTFDPVTLGHLDIIKRLAALYDVVYLAVAHSKYKSPLFSVEERVRMLEEALDGRYTNVIVESFEGLMVDYALAKSARVVVRGLRMISDFEYEFQMALTNRKINPKIETLFMMPNESYSYLSSRLIKEAAAMGADVSKFVTENVRAQLERKFSK
jgi:pantetheine-phosphate adenylyltransferase